MKRSSSLVLTALAGAASLCCGAAARADIAFGFAGNAIGQTTPFTNTVSGLSATFTNTGGAVGDGFVYGDPYNVLVNGSDPLDITFSAPIDNISSAFYRAHGATVTLTAYNAGALVGTVDNGVPGFEPGNHPILDFLNFSGVTFDEIRLTNFVALADVSTRVPSVPEPSAAAALGFAVLGTAMLVLRGRRRPVRF